MPSLRALGSFLAANIAGAVADGRSLVVQWRDIGPLPQLDAYLHADLDEGERAHFEQLLRAVLPTILVETPFDPDRAKRGATPSSARGRGARGRGASGGQRRSGRASTSASTIASQAAAAQAAAAPVQAAPAVAPATIDATAWTQLFERGEYAALVDFISENALSDTDGAQDDADKTPARILSDLERWIDAWLAWRDRSLEIAAKAAKAPASIKGKSFVEVVDEAEGAQGTAVVSALLPFFYSCERLQGVKDPLPVRPLPGPATTNAC